MFLFLHQFVSEHTFAANTKKGTVGDVPLCPLLVTIIKSRCNKIDFFEKKITNAIRYWHLPIHQVVIRPYFLRCH